MSMKMLVIAAACSAALLQPLPAPLLAQAPRSQPPASGYALGQAVTVQFSPPRQTTADVQLVKAHDIAAQLTNAEWLASFPGTEQEKASVRGCAHCHSLELVARSRHDADEFVKVVERMSGYPPLAFPLMPQRTPSPRIGAGP